MYVCTYVLTYVCMYVCVYVCMYVCMYVRTYLCMHVCTHVCMYDTYCLFYNGKVGNDLTNQNSRVVCVCVCVCVWVKRTLPLPKQGIYIQEENLFMPSNHCFIVMPNPNGLL